jgi:hypothetical protein
MTSYADDEKKREALKGAYSGAAWQEKVRNMTPDQVTAVYLRLKSQNKI